MKKCIILLMVMFLLGCNNQSDKAALKVFLQKQQSRMIFVEGGSFMQGPSDKVKVWQAPNNTPQKSIVLTSYYIDKYLVTWADFDFYTKYTKQPIADKEYKDDFFHNSVHPAESINWKKANAYCQWLAKESGLPYALPTEAQWEYAARSRGQDVLDSTNDGTHFPGINTPSVLQIKNQKGDLSNTSFSMPIGIFPPNSLGIYNMTDAVGQWVSDDGYAVKSGETPQKMVRGGGLATGEELAMTGSYFRTSQPIDNESPALGFRCVLNSTTPPTTPQKLTIRHADFSDKAGQRLYQQALPIIKSDPVLAKDIGKITIIGEPSGTIGWYPVINGEMGNGKGHFKITGEKGSATVYIAGTNHNQKPWQLVWLLVDYDNPKLRGLFIKGQRIDFDEEEPFVYQALTGKWPKDSYGFRYSGGTWYYRDE